VIVDVGDWVLVGVKVNELVILGAAVLVGVMASAADLLQAVSQQLSIITTNNSLTFLLFCDGEE
jgi:Asp/Glu/hydantoin racemase